MLYSEEKEEFIINSVSNYHFVDAKGELISFSVLPMFFDDMERPDAPVDQEVYLLGAGDGGLQKVFKQVTAWKLELESAQPYVGVLTKSNSWISLFKPRKIYEDSIRTILITIQLLHFLKRRPESSEKSLWDHLRRVFSSFEVPPSVIDLIDHYPLIKLLVERDNRLAESKLLLRLLKEKPRMKTIGVQDLQNDQNSKKPFIVENDLEDDEGNDDGDESEDEPALFDSVCAFCDNGGDILCCEGNCIRSFHATRKDGNDTGCVTLGFSEAQVESCPSFLCKNCEYKQHQCFVCGELGSSDNSSGTEVFRCVNATCGHFYHPKCIADLLFRENKSEAAECAKNIASGESFTCPAHKCHVCGRGENKEIEELQFAVCRRCPRSYHRKCLPRKIAFEDMEEEGIMRRAWEGLLPSRILIYCLKHKIVKDLGTPIRNHIKFPDTPGRKKLVDIQKREGKVVMMKKSWQIPANIPKERNYRKPIIGTEKLSSKEDGQPAVSCRSITSQVDFWRQLKPLKVGAEPDMLQSDGSLPLDSKKFLKEKAKAEVRISSFPKIDIETERKMIAFMEKTSSSLTMAEIEKKRSMPSIYRHALRNTAKSITLGKVEVSVEAVKTAFQKLKDGGTVEDAKAVCEPDIIKQIMIWNNKLKVYLAPFLHGMRYTSYGRHFTKVDKIKEIVDKLQWYVRNGDMIVDFCCGSNDFSRLMKEKLDAVGKKCSFKNYDIIQPKHDFSFEKRDWFTVQPEELPSGSQLIMGLNPPFGVNASLANQFINKALSFKPKLLILIVPCETERLDRKRFPYDLIWVDSDKLSGKSFYLPGSVDENDLQIEQWNVKAPPLYLWSRPDWTAMHRAIALKQGHALQSSEVQKKYITEAITPEATTRGGKWRSHLENEDNRSSKKRKSMKKAEEEVKWNEECEARKVEQEAADTGREQESSDMSISSEDTTHCSRDILDTTALPSHQRPGYDCGPSSVAEVMQDVGRGYATHNRSSDVISNHKCLIRNSDESYSCNNSSYAQPRPHDFQGEHVYSTSGHNNLSLSSSHGLSSLTPGSAPCQDGINVVWSPPLPSGEANDSFGFAPGPLHQFQRPSSGGWLDD